MNSWSVLTITALSLVLLTTKVHGDLTLFGCMNAYIYLSCPPDETLEVSQVRISEVENGPSACGGALARMGHAEVPQGAGHLCANPSACFYKEDVCKDKHECLFYIAGEHYNDDSVSKNKAVQIKYGCNAGMSRILGVSAIIIVTVALVICMVGTFFIIWRKLAPGGSESYVEFENRLSRTPSMSSEGNVRYSKNGSMDMVEVKVPPMDEYAMPHKITLDEKTASVI